MYTSSVLRTLHNYHLSLSKSIPKNSTMAFLTDYNEDESASSSLTVPEVKNQDLQDVQEEEKKEDETSKLLPNKENGHDMENYSWAQNLKEVSVSVPIPPGTTSKFVVCEINKNYLKVGVKNQPPVVEGELFKPVKAGDDCYWTLEDKRMVTVYLTKCDGENWWKSLLKGGPEIDTQNVEPEPSKLSDLDMETRSVVEKMMFDQRQKKLGLPTSEEIEKQNLMKQFMAQHPNVDFSGAKMF